MNRTATPAQLDLAALLRAAHAAEAAVEAELNGIGLSLAKLAALRVLEEAGESLPLTQLAERLSCVKSNITQLADRLEAEGLVVRQPDPHDRRTRLAVLTPAGRRSCQEGLRIQLAVERTVLGRLSGPESQQLAALLSKVATSA
jgi:DNA-binding MarR family transcriptional regulator